VIGFASVAKTDVSDHDFETGDIDPGPLLRLGESRFESLSTTEPALSLPSSGEGTGIGVLVGSWKLSITRGVEMLSCTPDMKCRMLPVLNRLDHDPREELDIESDELTRGGAVGDVDESRGQPGERAAARGFLCRASEK
jgi:hypothetical protein